MLKISWEKIREEIQDMLLNKNPDLAFRLLAETGLLKEILPELQATIGAAHNKHHREGDAFEHTMLVLGAASNVKSKGSKLALMWAALLHDIGKVPAALWNDKALDWSFPSHEIHSAEMSDKIMERFKTSNALREEVVYLCANHMRVHNILQMRKSKANELFNNPYIENLMWLKYADDVGRVPISRSYINAFKLYEDWTLTYVAPVEKRRSSGIDGHYIMSLGIKGKEIGDYLNLVEEMFEEGKNVETIKNLLVARAAQKSL